MSLFEAEPRPLPREEGVAASQVPEWPAGAEEPSPEQMDLFAEYLYRFGAVCSAEAVDVTLGPLVEPTSHAEAALAFWSCLRAAEDPECAETVLHEARRRMKQLRPAFHALYMRRVAARG